MKPVTLRTARLVLSTPTPSDVDAVYAACQDPELQKFVPVPVPYEREHAAGFVHGLVPQWWRDDIEYVFGMRSHEEAPLMGVVSWQRQRGFIGYWLAAEHRGAGLMTESVAAVVGWAFGHDDVEEIRWEAVRGNIASAVVAQRCGFRWEGIGRIGHVRADQEEGGWRAVLRRADHGTVQPSSDWPVLT